jgi:hypothetical protein
VEAKNAAQTGGFFYAILQINCIERAIRFQNIARAMKSIA